MYKKYYIERWYDMKWLSIYFILPLNELNSPKNTRRNIVGLQIFQAPAGAIKTIENKKLKSKLYKNKIVLLILLINYYNVIFKF